LEQLVVPDHRGQLVKLVSQVLKVRLERLVLRVREETLAYRVIQDKLVHKVVLAAQEQQEMLVSSVYLVRWEQQA
jgi:hypothetical protein